MTRGFHILLSASVFFLASHDLSFAQFHSSSSSDISLAPSVSFSVRDSLTGDLLPNAVISVICGRDTVKVVTGSDVEATLARRRLPASSLVITTFLGYRTRRDSLYIEPRVDTYVRIGMQEEPETLNSIIVKGNAIAMVMHGDTTVFNAAAFNTMEGNGLRNLLEQMPGVTVEENGVAYHGQRIDRILINGNNLFGKDIKNAMDMVLAKEVKSVKVYDNKAVDDMEDDGTVAKERVLDVHTWKPLNHVGELSLKSSGGMFTSRNADGKFDWNADGEVMLGSYTLGAKPRFSANVAGGHNSGSGQPTVQPNDELNGNFRVGKDIPGKSGYNHLVIFSSSGDRTSGGSIFSFFPSETWTERRDTSASENRKSGYSISYSGNGNFRRGKLSARMGGAISYAHARQNYLNRASSWQDANWSGFRKSIEDTTNRFKGSLSTSLTKTFAKRGRRMGIHLSISGAYDWGGGSRIDTLKNSIRKEWLSNSLSSGRVTPSLGATWNEPVGEKSSVVFSVATEYVYETTKKLFTDIFTNTLNLNNSKDFTTNYACGVLSAAYRYGRKNDGLYAFVSIGVQDIVSFRTERLESVPDWRRNYIRPVIGAELAYSRGENSLSLNYKEKESVPGIEQVRNALNDSNPLFLYAGNPKLSLPVTRTFSLRFGHSFPVHSASLEFNAGSDIHSNALVSRTTYYREQTWLDSYGYLVPAGSSMTTPVNVSGRFCAWAAGKYSQYLTGIKSDIGADITWNIQRDPFYEGDVRRINQNNSISVAVPFKWYGKTTGITLIPSVGAGRQEYDGAKLYDSVSLSGIFSYTQRIGGNFELNVGAQLYRMMTTRDDIGIFTHNATCTLSWLFGAEKRSRLSVFGNNLTSLVNNKTISVSDNYILTSLSNNFGRSFGLSFTYVFTRK